MSAAQPLDQLTTTYSTFSHTLSAYHRTTGTQHNMADNTRTPNARRSRRKATDVRGTAQRPPGLRERPSASSLAAVSSKRHVEIASLDKRTTLSTEQVYSKSQYAELERQKKIIKAVSILQSGLDRVPTPITEPAADSTISDIRQLLAAQRVENAFPLDQRCKAATLRLGLKLYGPRIKGRLTVA